VLVEGEPGTGKELIARAIHNHGRRRDRPFVAVNCGALPESLAESELFGFKRGAFTDASRDKPGRFALAAGGTLFLDEIGEISPAMQVKLLRVLQEREYMPLGGVNAEPADVRIIAATNRDLAVEVGYNRFRQDLFFRLNVVRVSIPPLRQRLEDIPLLVQHFIDKFNALQGRRISDISELAMAQLMNYDYPGNVRELENAIEHAFVVCGGGVIERENLPPHILGLQPAPLDMGLLRGTETAPAETGGEAASGGERGSSVPASRPAREVMPLREALPAREPLPMGDNRRGREIAPASAAPLASGPNPSPAGTPAQQAAAPSGPLESAEAETIRAALARTGGHRTRAAKELGISRNTLWRKMKRYGIT
jgi:transcriptional regulator with PAS, ATPase and Fis domain